MFTKIYDRELESSSQLERAVQQAQVRFDEAHATHLRAITDNCARPCGLNAARMSRARFARADAHDELVQLKRALRAVS